MLDVALPDHTGLSVLDRLKRDPRTRHIPVHMVSATDHVQTALSMGALGYMIKPVKRRNAHPSLSKVGRALHEGRAAFAHRRGRRGATRQSSRIFSKATTSRSSRSAASVKPSTRSLKIRSIASSPDLTLPDASGFDLLQKLGNGDAYAFPPVIVYTGRSLSASEEQQLRKYSSSIHREGRAFAGAFARRGHAFLASSRVGAPRRSSSHAQASARPRGALRWSKYFGRGRRRSKYFLR